jgi:glycosyltransferase involved in cell wall biosynthesis
MHAFDAIRADFPDLHLVIVGCQGWKADAIVRRIRTHREFGRRLHWLEGIGDGELAALYRRSTMVVIPSRYEGFGLPVVEALQFGCRTLASRAGALPEAGGDHAEYFDPDDASELARKLRDGLGDGVPAGRVGPAGPAFAVTGWNVAAERLGELLLMVRNRVSGCPGS